MESSVLHWTLTLCTALPFTSLHYTAPHCPSLHCTTLHCTALHTFAALQQAVASSALSSVTPVVCHNCQFQLISGIGCNYSQACATAGPQKHHQLQFTILYWTIANQLVALHCTVQYRTRCSELHCTVLYSTPQVYCTLHRRWSLLECTVMYSCPVLYTT